MHSKTRFIVSRILLSLGLLFAYINAGAQPAYYNKHIIIVVDQSHYLQGHPNIQPLYDAIKDVLIDGQTNKMLTSDSFIPSGFSFDPKTDQISLFASSIKGSGLSNIEDYREIRNMCNNNEPEKDVIDKVINSLIHPRADFQSSGKTLSGFLDENLLPMMSNHDPLLSGLPDNASISLNPYLYPLSLIKVNKSVKAKEYYLFLVSSFISQGQIGSLHTSQVEPLLANLTKYIAAFDSEVLQSQSPFYKLGTFKIQLPYYGGNANLTNKNPQVDAFQLGLTCLNKVGVNVYSRPDFFQKEYQSASYHMTGSKVRFNHDDNVKIDKVELVITSAKLNEPAIVPLLSNSYEVENALKTDLSGRYYEFEDKDIELVKRLNEDDNLNLNYVFYTSSVNQNGSELIPYVFTTDVGYDFAPTNFVANPKYFWAKILASIVAILLAITGVLLLIRKKNGIARKAWVDFVVRPITYTRYMEIKDKKVVNKDCWYVGPDNQNQKITIEGTLSLEEKVLCKNNYYRLEYLVSDADTEDAFTFKPYGTDNQGLDRRSDHWYKVDYDEKTGKFRFNVWTYVDTERYPDLKDPERLTEFLNDPEHPNRLLKLFIKFRIIVQDPKTAITTLQLPDPENPEKNSLAIFTSRDGSDETRFEQIYNFVVKPDFDRKTAWVAFDPGTNGACAAFAFSGHQPSEKDAVTLAMNQYSRTDTEDGKKETSCIFPSIVKISDRSHCFDEGRPEVITNVENWKIGVNEDFIFGNMADQRLGNNRFQSIKKLLGYTTDQEIRHEKKNVTRKIAGRELAHLLVKGLYDEVGKFATEHESVDKGLRENLTDSYGNFAPQRAIVAVPNNYTLLKVQDMVDSVKRLNCFHEVHYIYESEGVMMSYLHQMWSKLSSIKDKLFVVYDMGGATINATAFTLDVAFDQAGNPSNCIVKTIAKIGYCVGGDDIDYALIRLIYNLPAVKRKLGNGDIEEKIKENMQSNKQKLIRFATKLKLDLIDIKKGKAKEENLRVFKNNEALFNEISSLLENCGVYVDPTDFGDEDNVYLYNEIQTQDRVGSIMYEIVYSKVIDAVSELLNGIDNRPIQLIFGGRSTLYPHISEYVINTIKKKGFTNCEVWDGFNGPDGFLDADLVKTAVAKGACWYAVFNYLITLEHDVVTSTFGYIDQQGGQQKFVPIVRQNERFEDNKCSHEVQTIAPTLINVRFVQMLGSDYNTILSDYDNKGKNKHKMNVLDIVPGEIVNGSISKIRIEIDNQNNFSYVVETSSTDITPETNRYSRIKSGSNNLVQTEIKDENNDSYVFAAITTMNEKNVNTTIDEVAENTTQRTRRRL